MNVLAKKRRWIVDRRRLRRRHAASASCWATRRSDSRSASPQASSPVWLRGVRTLRTHNPNGVTHASSCLARLRRCASVVASSYIVATTGALPDNVASHFGPGNAANGFMTRDGYLVFMLFFALVLPLFLAAMIGLLPRMRAEFDQPPEPRILARSEAPRSDVERSIGARRMARQHGRALHRCAALRSARCQRVVTAASARRSLRDAHGRIRHRDRAMDRRAVPAIPQSLKRKAHGA